MAAASCTGSTSPPPWPPAATRARRWSPPASTTSRSTTGASRRRGAARRGQLRRRTSMEVASRCSTRTAPPGAQARGLGLPHLRLARPQDARTAAGAAGDPRERRGAAPLRRRTAAARAAVGAARPARVRAVGQEGAGSGRNPPSTSAAMTVARVPPFHVRGLREKTVTAIKKAEALALDLKTSRSRPAHHLRAHHRSERVPAPHLHGLNVDPDMFSLY